MLASVGAYILSIALVLLSSNAFRQALNEFRDTEPGSLLFGVLQVVIGASAAAASFGVFTRAKLAARSIGICGAAAAGLLVSQPLFEPMAPDAQRPTERIIAPRDLHVIADEAPESLGHSHGSQAERTKPRHIAEAS